MSAQKSKSLKATFQHISSHKENFLGKDCILPISVGQPYHEFKKFAATIKLINKYFSACTIMVCDTLQRHTLKLYGNINDSTAYKKSLKLGEEWIERNITAINALTIPVTIKRWDEWLNAERFKESVSKIETLYENNKDFRASFFSCAEKFIKKYTEKFDNVFPKTHNELVSICVDYLKEECAVLLVWDKENYAYEAYPGENNETIRKTYELCLVDRSEYKNMVPLKIKFK